MLDISKLFSRPCIIGLCANVNTGKSMVLYHIITKLQQKHQFKLYSYGLRCNLGEQKIYSVEELETIENSIIICDEFFGLFDLDNRKKRKIIENTLRLINHNNNILILAGLPENYKKFISAKLDVVIFKKSSLADFVNGSRIKNVCTSYKGNELGSTVLNLAINEILVFDGLHFSKEIVPYYKEYDSKKENIPILTKCDAKRSAKCANNVQKNKSTK